LALGADVVEIDIRRTKDDQFVLFHDYALECRTDAVGAVADHTARELRVVDVGYGYTADGRTFPLRGKGLGFMPTLEESLAAHPGVHFLIQIKDADAKTARLLVDYLDHRGLSRWEQLAFFGSNRPLAQLKALRPAARIWSASSAARCLREYIEFGWTGRVPYSCAGGMIIVPISQSGFLWGWPDRFLARMRDHETEVMLVGGIGSLRDPTFSRLDTLDELKKIPPGFSGDIWTDRIDIIGPALQP
jgi:glycerophosphoryl diester phosphodiesterase